MDKEIEDFCTYLAKMYVRLMKHGIPHPVINCWMANSITLFYMNRDVKINIEFKQIMDGLKDGQNHQT